MDGSEALIHLRVPAEQKARWVRENKNPHPPPEHPPDAQVHLRVPMAVKAQWVRESRACGMKLTDWLLQRIEKGST